MIGRGSLVAAIAAACFAGFATAASATPVLHNQHLKLNSYSPAHTGYAGPEYTNKPLGSGDRYVIKVRGVYSAYLASLMDGQPGWHMCGTPETRAHKADLFGQDAEFIFALPKPNAVHCPNMPFHHANLQFSTDHGSSWSHVEPVGGTPSSPSSNHRYTYVVTGSGQDAGFRLHDTNTTDNYGKLGIRIHKARKSDCATLYSALGFSSVSACRAALPE